MKKHLNIRLQLLMICLLVFGASYLSVLHAQNSQDLRSQNSQEVQSQNNQDLQPRNSQGRHAQNYSDPSEIDPLNIDARDFFAEDLISIGAVADMSYRQGNYLDAARNYLYMVQRNVDDCESYYKIASCYAKLNMANYAIDFLIMAVNAGYSNFENIRKNEEFDFLMEDTGVKHRFDDLLQHGDKLGQTSYFIVEKLEKCRIFFPDNYNAQKEYPLIIGLHGNGDNSRNFSDLWLEIKDQDVIFAVPESPYNYTNTGGSITQQHSWSIISNDRELWKIADPLMTKYISDIASGLKTKYKINKTILFGFSQGAAFAYASGIRYNNIIDGLICFGGRIASVEDYPWFLSQRELEENNTAKIFIAHGTNDRAISSSEGRKSYRLLKKNGYDTKFRLFEGGHSISGKLLVEAINWLRQPSLPQTQ